MKKKMYIIISVALFAIFIECKAQSKIIMETIYEKKLDTITLKLMRNNITYGNIIRNGSKAFEQINNAIGYVDWYTILINNQTNDSITIDKHHSEKNTTQWRLGEMNGESPIHFYNIVNSYLKDDKLYIIRYAMGFVFLEEYKFDSSNNFKKEIYPLSFFPALTAFGTCYSLANIMEFSSNTFFYFDVGTTLGSGTEGLYRQDKTHLYQYRLLNENIRIKDTRKVFKSLNLDEERELIQELIQQVLIEAEKTNKIQYLGYLDNLSSHYDKINTGFRADGIIHLFYEDDNGKINIINYDNYENEWLIGDYEEVEIKPIQK